MLYRLKEINIIKIMYKVFYIVGQIKKGYVYIVKGKNLVKVQFENVF